MRPTKLFSQIHFVMIKVAADRKDRKDRIDGDSSLAQASCATHEVFAAAEYAVDGSSFHQCVACPSWMSVNSDGTACVERSGQICTPKITYTCTGR